MAEIGKNYQKIVRIAREVVALLVLVLAAVLLSTVVYWIVEGQRPVVTPSPVADVPVTPNTVDPSDPNHNLITTYSTFCKHSDASITWVATVRSVDRRISRQVLEDDFDGSPPACFDPLEWGYVVPTVPEGEYYFEILVTYHVNPISDSRVFFITEPFTVKYEGD